MKGWQIMAILLCLVVNMIAKLLLNKECEVLPRT